MPSYTPNFNLFKYDTTADAKAAFSIQDALNNNWDILDEALTKTSMRNIGEIVTSTIPLTDAGLHLLDGSLLTYGIYSDFIDYIASLYESGNYSNIFTTESAWQSSITTYGTCGKFVYNSTNDTVRLPKIHGFIEGASLESEAGTLMEAGLPNITGWFYTGTTGTGGACFTVRKTGDGHGSTKGTGNDTWDFDASKSNDIYGNSNTVQPQSIKVLYYIVIATTTKTDIQVDIDEIATDLNSKCHKIDVAYYAHKLDWNNTILVSTTNSHTYQTYECPSDGILTLRVFGTANSTRIMNSTATLQLDGVYIAGSPAYNASSFVYCAGDTACFEIYGTGSGAFAEARFTPFKKS